MNTKQDLYIKFKEKSSLKSCKDEIQNKKEVDRRKIIYMIKIKNKINNLLNIYIGMGGENRPFDHFEITYKVNLLLHKNGNDKTKIKFRKGKKYLRLINAIYEVLVNK